jgi:hypothetical protein
VSFPDTKPVRLRAIQLLAGNNLRVPHDVVLAVILEHQENTGS